MQNPNYRQYLRQMWIWPKMSLDTSDKQQALLPVVKRWSHIRITLSRVWRTSEQLQKVWIHQIETQIDLCLFHKFDVFIDFKSDGKREKKQFVLSELWNIQVNWMLRDWTEWHTLRKIINDNESNGQNNEKNGKQNQIIFENVTKIVPFYRIIKSAQFCLLRCDSFVQWSVYWKATTKQLHANRYWNQSIAMSNCLSHQVTNTNQSKNCELTEVTLATIVIFCWKITISRNILCSANKEKWIFVLSESIWFISFSLFVILQSWIHWV